VSDSRQTTRHIFVAAKMHKAQRRSMGVERWGCSRLRALWVHETSHWESAHEVEAFGRSRRAQLHSGAGAEVWASAGSRVCPQLRVGEPSR
jgi:hypothetical protein